jgi:hypothetical protein
MGLLFLSTLEVVYRSILACRFLVMQKMAKKVGTKTRGISYHWWSRDSRGWQILWSRCNDDRKIN